MGGRARGSYPERDQPIASMELTTSCEVHIRYKHMSAFFNVFVSNSIQSRTFDQIPHGATPSRPEALAGGSRRGISLGTRSMAALRHKLNTCIVTPQAAST